MTRQLRVIVTRPAIDAEPFAQAIRARGWVAVAAPLLDIVDLGEPAPDLTGVEALAFTSANGVRAFANASSVRGLKVFAVGPATAATARAEGFAHVETAGGDVHALAALIGDASVEGEILHVCGRARAGDLVAALIAQGRDARRAVLYDARAAARLPRAACAALTATPPAEWATFFSPRTARIFCALVKAEGLGAHLGGVRACGLSPAVAEALSGAGFAEVVAAPAYDADAVLETIARHSPQRS